MFSKPTLKNTLLQTMLLLQNDMNKQLITNNLVQYVHQKRMIGWKVHNVIILKVDPKMNFCEQTTAVT